MFKDVKDSIPITHRSNFVQVDDHATVEIDKMYAVNETENRYVNSLGGKRHAKRKLAQKADNIRYIRQDTKTVGSGRKVKYSEQEGYLIDIVTKEWETGDPLSKSMAYDALMQRFNGDDGTEQTEWEKKMVTRSGSIFAALCQWATRVLNRHRFSLRKESISQTVPTNWLYICVESTNIIRANMSKAQVTRLINADEMFLQYYPKESYLIAPTNVKRVGSNRHEDEKKGCTVMIACEMFESRMMAPYLVMDGTRDGRLAKQYADWDGFATVTFQKNHWMDAYGCLLYLEWLKECVPDDRIGLIWDHTSSHICNDVMNKEEELNITIGLVPAGCTSVLQVCDLIANKPIKGHFKRQYASWKIKNNPGPGGKYKVTRDETIGWMDHFSKVSKVIFLLSTVVQFRPSRTHSTLEAQMFRFVVLSVPLTHQHRLLRILVPHLILIVLSHAPS